LLLNRRDRRIREPDDLRRVFGYPLLGLVPESDAYQAQGTGETSDLPARELEAFSLLRAHLRYFNVDRVVRTVLVTSAAPGEGKTTVAHNLAKAAVAMGTRTLLIQADMLRPILASRLGFPSGPGLGEVLIDALPVATAIRPPDVAHGMGMVSPSTRLDVLVAGIPPPNPAELIESRAMADLLSWSANEYDLVLICAHRYASAHRRVRCHLAAEQGGRRADRESIRQEHDRRSIEPALSASRASTHQSLVSSAMLTPGAGWTATTTTVSATG
jgi:hypothetical protein